MFKKSYVKLALSQIVVDDDISKEAETRQSVLKTYKKMLRDKGVQIEQLVVHRQKALNIETSSGLWIMAILDMFRNNESAPDGIEVVDGEWLVPVTSIMPCEKCTEFLGKRCRCQLR